MSDDSAAAEARVICGPTGAGKTAVALWIAERLAPSGCTIVSADSRQIYRGFDIGTAKPNAEERARAPHEGIDVADPGERYSAARWAAAARAWIEDARATGRTPLVVGGTGLYLRALYDGLFIEPPLDPHRRQALSRYLDSVSTEMLRTWVAAVDADRAHLGRTQLLRAVEIATLAGTRISELHRAQDSAGIGRARVLVVDPGTVLSEWNARRVDRMLSAGWLDEVRGLLDTAGDDAPAWNASGYGVMRRLASGEFDLSSAREAIVIETRQYVKRQRTWFRHQLGAHEVTRIDPSAEGWQREVERWWTGAGATA